MALRKTTRTSPTMANSNSRDQDPGGGDRDLLEIELAASAKSSACVLLTGTEAAVQTIARRIHDLSERSRGPFETVCCEWPEADVEARVARIFGETPGQPGEAGTVLLYEVGLLSPVLQSRLADGLMWLGGPGRQGFTRLRVMASTSSPLLPRVEDGTFDDRLFYRLNVIHLVVPPVPSSSS